MSPGRPGRVVLGGAGEATWSVAALVDGPPPPDCRALWQPAADAARAMDRTATALRQPGIGTFLPTTTTVPARTKGADHRGPPLTGPVSRTRLRTGRLRPRRRPLIARWRRPGRSRSGRAPSRAAGRRKGGRGCHAGSATSTRPPAGPTRRRRRPDRGRLGETLALRTQMR